MLKNNYEEVKEGIDEAFLQFIGYGEDKQFGYAARNAVYQQTKDEKIPIIGLQADGIVNSKLYLENDAPKILCLMYESYRRGSDFVDYIWNLAEWLGEKKEEDMTGMFKTVQSWLEAIFEKLNIPITEYKYNLLNYCAWMNISKLGRTTANKSSKVLKEAVKSEKNAVAPYLYPAIAEKLTEQLLSYDPDIIICGNTERLLYTFLTNAGMKDLFPDGNGRVDIKNKRLHLIHYRLKGKDVAVFYPYHPSVRNRQLKATKEDFLEIIANNETWLRTILKR
ncbi:MAG: hypothetical protein J6B05_02525 [Clostridia bacterium]|nr:hypothetical protein [Clostridia bacterium]